MFEKLFALPATIAKHQQGPMAEERRHYLANSLKTGLSHTRFAQRPITCWLLPAEWA
jgi:hypothetical protein